MLLQIVTVLTSLVTNVAMAATKPKTTAATMHTDTKPGTLWLRWLPSQWLIGPINPTATGGSWLAVPVRL